MRFLRLFAALAAFPALCAGDYSEQSPSAAALPAFDDDDMSLLHRKTQATGTRRISAADAMASVAELFPPGDRPGRLPSEHRTVTMGGFLFNPVLNGRYTERFGKDYVVNGRETYWSDKLDYFIYYCSPQSRWSIFLTTKLEAVRDNHECWFTAGGPLDAELVDSALPQGWSEWDVAAGHLVEVPTAGLHVLSTQEGLEGVHGSHDSLDIFPQCKRPPYQPIDYDSAYDGTLSDRERMYSYEATNQGTCDDCWAVASAALIERLLCIRGAGNFMGPRTAISAAYIASCAAEAFFGHNGCEGGFAAKALQWAGEHGVPTGGHGGDRKTCVPMFDIHFREPTVAPSCPTQCTNELYPRSLTEDLFFPEGLKYSWETTAYESARLAMDATPILIVIPMYEDFYEYKGGMYNHSWGRYLGDHTMIAHGYRGERIQGFNSWGSSWGHEGLYWIHRELVKSYIIPGAISGLGKGYPYPLPQATSKVTLAGFSNKSLNGVYELFMHEYGTVSGLSTFWKTDNLVLYWCVRQNFHAIARVPDSVGWRDVAPYLEKDCPWQAHGPVLDKFEPIGRLHGHQTGWFEGSDTTPVQAAGIVKVEKA